jgi:hypothetical protein
MKYITSFIKKPKHQLSLLIAAIFMVPQLIVVLGATPNVSAQGQDDKVTICHRTNSVKNPYVRNTVDDDAADGNTGNDKGKGDHSQHTGPVATSEAVAQALKDDKRNWGDIIPPHHNYAGLNWTTDGQAVYNNDCKYISNDKPPVQNGDNPTTPTDDGQILGEQTSPAAGGVGAGFGGGAGSIAASAFGLVTSLSALGYGAVSLVRRKS